MQTMQGIWARARSPRWGVGAAMLAVSLAIGAIALLICNVVGDTRATLLVSQEIVRHGSVRLDHHGDAELERYGYAIVHKNGHAYDSFPIGTPLLSAPFVAAANLLGFDARDVARPLQAVIVASAIVALAWLLFGLARLFLDPWPSVVLATLCVFGTSIASSGLVTLFSHDFAVLAATAAIFHVVRGLRTDSSIHAPIVASCLFLAYLCRPTMALLAPFLLLYLFVHRHATALRAAALLAGLLAAFVLWSLQEYAQWLPDYYLPQRLEGGDFSTAAWQNLFGPSRGLFVYSPFLGLVPILVAYVLYVRRDTNHARMLIVGLAWPLAHWLTISRFPHWWGGWSYGPRLMLDCLPGLFLALFHSLHLLAARERRMAGISLAVLGAGALYVNTWQAFATPYPTRWAAEPNIDEYPEYLFDWRYPQFLYSAERHRARMEEFNRILEFVADVPDSQFSGFSPLQGDLRWNGAGTSTVQLPLGMVGRPEGRLLVDGEMIGSHRLRVLVNGQVVHDRTHSGAHLRIPLVFDPAMLGDGLNVVAFELPDAPASAQLFGFRSLSVYPLR